MKIFIILALFAVVAVVALRYESRSRRKRPGAEYDASTTLFSSHRHGDHGHHHHADGQVGHGDSGGSDGGGSDGSGGADGGGSH
jgi:uncharacterized membrane protein YgcG